MPPFILEVNDGATIPEAMKECPLCGETMRLSVREVRDTIPGSGPSAVRVTREWICPECDYFEEAEAGEE